MRRGVLRSFLLVILGAVLIAPSWVAGQVAVESPAPDKGNPGRMMKNRRGGGDAMPAVPNGAQFPGGEQPKPPEKNGGGPAGKKDGGPAPVSRPAAVTNPAAHLEPISVDDKKMVSFNFEEAPWTFVLDQLARVSGMTLDWQQLPGDSINLRLQRQIYSCPGTRHH